MRNFCKLDPSLWQIRIQMCAFCVRVCVSCSVKGNFYNRAYYLLDEALTWTEARDSCREDNNGFLAVANNDNEFDFLRAMYDNYRSQGGSAIGAWIDGEYYNVTKKWHCHSNVNYADRDDTCGNDMPWSHGEPNRNDTEHCILVWYSRRDGVANYRCNATMPAICATYRYFITVNILLVTLFFC